MLNTIKGLFSKTLQIVVDFVCFESPYIRYEISIKKNFSYYRSYIYIKRRRRFIVYTFFDIRCAIVLVNLVEHRSRLGKLLVLNSVYHIATNYNPIHLHHIILNFHSSTNTVYACSLHAYIAR